jgi:hypothetical protein
MAQDTAQVDMEHAPAQGSDQASKPTGFVRATEFLLLATVIAGVLDTLRFAAYFIPLRFALNYEEGNQLNAALRITHGQNPFPPVGGLPYIVNPYGPVFYYAVAPLVKWFGLSFVAPRLLVLASGLAVALFLVLLLRLWTKSWVISLGFGLAFLAVSLVRTWIYVLRVDLFGLALAMAGLYVFTSSRKLIWPALLFLAAIYTKMTLISAPIACFLYMMSKGERRRAWRFTGWMLLFGLGGLAALDIGTHGWGIFHMFLTHADVYRVRWYLSRLRPFAFLNVALVAGAIALGVHDYRRRVLSLPLVYVVLATAMTFTIGQWANDGNHLLEWQAALSLAAGYGYSALRSRSRVDATIALIPVGIIILVFAGMLHGPQLSPELVGCPAAYRFAAQQPGPLLTGNSGAAVLSGKKVWLSNSFEYSILGKAGRLNQEPLTQLVQRRFFGLILLTGNIPELERAAAHPRKPSTIWPAPFVSALAQNYHQVAQFSCAGANFAYEPNIAGSPPPPAKH